MSSDDRNLWVDIGLALKNTGSPAAYGLWNEWSQTSEKYDASDMEKRWAGFKPKKITLGTLFFKAKNLGWDWPHDSTALNKYRGIYPQYFYGFDDNSHVERFTVQYGELYLFDTRKDKDCWRLFDGARYDGIHRNYFEETVNQVFKNIKQEKQFALDFAKEKYEKDEDREKFMGSFYALYTKVKNNNVKSAGKQIELALSRDDFDENNGNLINCKNVTLHVDSSGNVTQIADRETRQRLKLTRVFDVVYDVDAECPKFIKFIRQLFPSDTLVFIQMFLGHCLIDVIKSKNRIFLVVEGAPGTGKTTLFNVLAVLFGDYACPAIEGLFATAPNPDMKKANPGFIATLNKRLVYLPEIEKESILSASNIKRMTGGDNIAERALYADVQEYSGREDNTARVVMYCNLTPRIDCVDDAIEERVKIVPCLPAINEEDRIYNLEDELLNERSGILNWLLTGLKSYIQNDYDFEYPQSVRIKTDEWLSMHDNVKRGTTYFETFYETELISDINGKVKITDLADYYAKKCIDNGYTKDAGNDKKFHDLMESHGHEKFKTGGILVYKGLRCPNL
ncbi:MAG: hypothetical protein GY754_41625, partial [bacterium]|nr:hypothetical protein [bacterium]